MLAALPGMKRKADETAPHTLSRNVNEEIEVPHGFGEIADGCVVQRRCRSYD